MTEETKWPDPFEGVLTADELEKIKRRVAGEYKARRRRAPSWNPDTDPPWRLLEHCFIAALRGCDRLSTSDLETVIARGTAWITGTRDDVIGDFLPNRIETLIAAAERRYFYFGNNSITTTYSKPPDGLSHRSLITFKNVRAHWPMLVEALQTAGFEISAASKQVRRGSPQPATQNLRARPRGRPPSAELDATVAKMKTDLAEKRLTPETLNAKSPKDLAEDYRVSKYIAGQARSKILKSLARQKNKSKFVRKTPGLRH